MADSNQASFIPKSTTATSHKVRKTKRIYILSYISYVLFFGTVVVVLGAYFYGIQVDRALEIKKEELLDKQSRFNDSHVQYVTELEERISLAEGFSANSVAPSKLFTALEETVAESVVYTNFNYERTDEGNLVATFEGDTEDFDRAIFQRETLEENDILKTAMVSDFSYGEVSEETGQQSQNEGSSSDINRVLFTYEAILDPSVIKYDPSIYDPIEDLVEEESFDEVEFIDTDTDTETVPDNQESL